VSAAARAWLARRSERERRLLLVAGATMLASAALAAGLAIRDDRAQLAARVTAHTRELALVRRLGATVAGATAPGDDTLLVTRLDLAASAAGVADRVASMTPAADGGLALALRVAGASLAETVGLLHALDDAGTPVAVSRLVLRKHPDDPGRFDVTVEVAAGRPAP
jgi:hypothetical protein